jgi:hypothetical protein
LVESSISISSVGPFLIARGRDVKVQETWKIMASLVTAFFVLAVFCETSLGIPWHWHVARPSRTELESHPTSALARSPETNAYLDHVLINLGESMLAVSQEMELRSTKNAFYAKTGLMSIKKKKKTTKRGKVGESGA